MRLIDADALIEFIVEEVQDLRTLSTKTVGQAISKTPTVDAVPVIRCKDCKYNPEKAMSYLDDDLIERYIHCGHLGDEGFCSLGKRKEE